MPTENTRRVDRNTIGVWRWQAAIAFAIFSLPLFGVMLRAPTPAAWLLPVLYAVVAICSVWWLPQAHYDALEYQLDEHGITIQRGIFWRSRIALPRIRVQHSDVSQGPLQRRFGVATLKLYTAGSRFVKIELPGLTHADALALRESLVASGGESGV